MQEWDSFVRNLSGVSVRGGETFFTIDAAYEALEWVENHDATLLGIEGFRLTRTATAPSMDHIADFSTPAPATAGSTTVADARQLLGAWRDEIDAVVLVIDAG